MQSLKLRTTETPPINEKWRMTEDQKLATNFTNYTKQAGGSAESFLRHAHYPFTRFVIPPEKNSCNS